MIESLELRALLRAMVLPPGGPLLLALSGLIMMRLRRLQRLGYWSAVTGMTMLFLLSLPIVTGVLERSVESSAALDLRHPVPAQAIVILGGGHRKYAPEYARSALNDLTLQRVIYGAHVARATRLPILVTGKDPEGAAMAQLLSRDLQSPARWLENQARDTHENATRSAAMLRAAGIDTVVLVTSALHMRRSVAEFEAAGMRVVPAPVDVSAPYEFEWRDLVPRMAALEGSHYALYESLGNLVRLMRGSRD